MNNEPPNKERVQLLNAQCWIDVRPLATLVRYAESRGALQVNKTSDFLRELILSAVDQAEKQGAMPFHDTHAAVEYLLARGFSMKQLNSPKNSRSSLSSLFAHKPVQTHEEEDALSEALERLQHSSTDARAKEIHDALQQEIRDDK